MVYVFLSDDEKQERICVCVHWIKHFMDFGFCGSNSIRNLDQSYEIVFNLDQWEIVYKFIHIYFQFCPKVFHATVGKIASIFFDSTPFDIFIQISFPTITKQYQYDEGISMKFINIAYIYYGKLHAGFAEFIRIS